MGKLEINRYSEAYIKEVVGLILNIQQNEFGIPIQLSDQPDLITIPDFYQKDNGNFWVATIDKAVVGTIALLDIGNQSVALRKMFVKSEFRGSKLGVGQTLLETAMKWTSKMKIDKIYLGTTEKFLAAQRFYEKNGFKEITKNELPEDFPIMNVDVRFYEYVVS